MLNELRIRIDPYQDTNTATVNGRPLSPYSELSNYLKEPFLKWAGKLLETSEREINDDYQLTVIGEKFEGMLLEDLQTDDDACIGYSTDSFTLDLSPTDRFKILAELARTYHITLSAKDVQMPVCLDTSLVKGNRLVRQTDAGSAAICITEDVSKAQLAVRKGAFLTLCISSGNRVSFQNGNCIWEVQRNRFPAAANAILDRFVTIPAVVKVSKKIKEEADHLSSDDLQKAELATAIDLFVRIPEIPEIEAGSTYTIHPKVYPPGKQMPKLRLRSSNPAILSVNGFQLQAIAPGKATVEFYREDAIIPFVRKQITIATDHYVRRIDLSVPETATRVGETQQITAELEPEGAEDAHTLKWEVSDPGIGKIDSYGNFTAANIGIVTVRASTEHAEQYLDIEVLPDVQGIQASLPEAILYVGETTPIDAFVFPQNCYDTRYYWSSSNPRIASVVELEDGTTVIKATSFGECVLSCITADGTFSDTCNVHVESTFRRKKTPKTLLAVSFTALVLAFLCAIFAFTGAATVCATAAVLFGVIYVLKTRTDLVWVVLIVAGATAILFGIRSGWF